MLHPLTDLLSAKHISGSFNFNDDALAAFHAAKSALANATMLTHPSAAAPYCLMVDASNVAVGGVLQQQLGDTWYPISFFSKKLQPAELKYSTFGRELLAIYLSIRHFRHFLEGYEFYVLTDHKPLIHALSASPSRYSPRETHHLDFISQFTSDIRHIRGQANPVADALSRMEINALNSPAVIDFHLLAAAQLVYGTTLRLPGQFITPLSSTTLDPTIYVDHLQCALCDIKPVQPRSQATKTYLPKDLSSCTHVYVRTDAVRTPLQPPYTGPYLTLRRHDKHYTLDVNGRKEHISLDRLKVTYLDTDLLPSSSSVMTPVLSRLETSGSVPAAPIKTH